MAKTIFQVVLVRIPGSSTSVNLEEPNTVRAAVEAAGENVDSWKYQINGQEVGPDTEINEHTGTIRMFIQKVKCNA